MDVAVLLLLAAVIGYAAVFFTLGHLGGWGVGAWTGCFCLGVVGLRWFRRKVQPLGRRRWLVLAAFSAMMVGGVGMVTVGDSTFVCWQCGATRRSWTQVGWPVVSRIDLRDISRRVEVVLGRACAHPHWAHASTHTGMGTFIDDLPSQRIPVLMMGPGPTEHAVVCAIERIPDPRWAAAALLAVGDRDNRLKYVAALALMDLRELRPADGPAWKTWWDEHGDALARTQDSGQALPIAKRILDGRGGRSACELDFWAGIDMPELRGSSW